MKLRQDRMTNDELAEALRDVSVEQMLAAWPRMLEAADARARVDVEKALSAIRNFGPMALADYFERNPLSPALIVLLRQRLQELHRSDASRHAANSKHASQKAWVREEFEKRRDDYKSKHAFAEAYREKLRTAKNNPHGFALTISVQTIWQRWLPKASR